MKNYFILFLIFISFSSYSQNKFKKSFFKNNYYKNLDFFWNENDKDDSHFYNIGKIQSVYKNKSYKDDGDMTGIAPAFVDILCTSGLNKGKILTITINLNNNVSCKACVIFNKSLNINSKLKFLIGPQNYKFLLIQQVKINLLLTFFFI
jgi:hypothetical protein